MTSRLLEPVLIVLLIAASAFIAADIVNTITRAAMHTPAAFAVPAPIKKPPKPAPPPFAAAPQPPSVIAPPVKLIGTTTGAYPSAVILMPGAKEQQIFRLRDDVGDGWRISEIRTNRIVLKNGDQKAIVELSFAEAAPANPRGVAPALAVPRAGIRLDPRDVESALSDLNKVVTQARVVPYTVNGKIAGYTIFDIVPDSVYTKLGLHNNDVVERVNGVEIKSPDALYHLFQQIRTERRLALDVSRNGKRETVNVEIR